MYQKLPAAVRLTFIAVAAGIYATIASAPVIAQAVLPNSSTVTVGDSRNPVTLDQQLNDAYKGGARKIIVRPGTYFLPSPGGTDGGVLSLNGWSDVVISAYHTTLILTDLKSSRSLWELDNCSDVTIEGGTVSQNQVTAYQGRVVATGRTTDGKCFADWLPATGYPLPPSDSTKFPGAANIVDKNTHFLKVGNTDYYDCPMSQIGDGRFRIIFAQPSLNFGVEDWIVGRYGDAPFKVHLIDCKNCTVKDLVMMRNGFANVREEGGGGNHVLGCKWALGPRPKGATESPLVTNSADGLHSTGANPGPDIEDCDFEGVLLDDCIAVHGSFTEVTSSTDTTFTIASKDSQNLAIGDNLRFTNSSGYFAEAKAVSVIDNGNGTSTFTLDTAINVPVGAKFSDTTRDGPGYKILRCRIGGTRSRGVLLKGDNGLIDGNTFTNCGMSAVSLGPEFYWGESNYVHNVKVQNNVFTHNGLFGSGGACVWVHGEGAVGNQNIIIQNNRFQDDLQTNVQIEWASGVTIIGNRFRGAVPWPTTVPSTSVISLDNCHDITLIGNLVYDAQVFKPDLVSTDATATGIQNNDKSGVSAALP